MGKPSEILARLERDDEGNITQVMVGGKAAITGERTVEI
jgi:predicted PhzF superfamily epimerase YddE/YHI9